MRIILGRPPTLATVTATPPGTTSLSSIFLYHGPEDEQPRQPPPEEPRRRRRSRPLSDGFLSEMADVPARRPSRPSLVDTARREGRAANMPSTPSPPSRESSATVELLRRWTRSRALQVREWRRKILSPTPAYESSWRAPSPQRLPAASPVAALP